MEIKVSQRFARIAPRKLRPFVALVKKQSLSELLSRLSFYPKKGSKFILNLLKQAKNIAEMRGYTGDLFVDNLIVNEGPSYKRQRIESRGRASIYRHRLSHITLVASSERVKSLKSQKEMTLPSKKESLSLVKKAEKKIFKSKEKSENQDGTKS